MGGMGAAWLFWSLLVVGLALLVVVAVRVLGGGVRARGDGPGDALGAGGGRAREVLDERYARGELSTQEYEERLRGLSRGGA